MRAVTTPSSSTTLCRTTYGVWNWARPSRRWPRGLRALTPKRIRLEWPFLVEVIPDENPGLEPTVHIHSHDEHVIPYEIMRWFMEHVAEQVERCRIVTSVGQVVT